MSHPVMFPATSIDVGLNEETGELGIITSSGPISIIASFTKEQIATWRETFNRCVDAFLKDEKPAFVKDTVNGGIEELDMSHYPLTIYIPAADETMEINSPEELPLHTSYNIVKTSRQHEN